MKNEDISSARVDDGPTSLTSFSMIAEPSAPENSIGDGLVGKGAEAPKPCISSVEMRTPTAAGGLLPASTASTAMKGIFPRPFFLGASVKRPWREPVRQTSTSLPVLFV